MNESELNSNIDALIMLSAKSLIEEDLEIMRAAEDEVEVPSRVHRKILRKVRNYDKKTETPQAIFYARRIAAVFLIICTISFAFCLSVEAIRTEIWNTIVEWYEEYVEIHFENSGAVANVIEEYKEPLFVPEGYERQLIMQTPISLDLHYNLEGIRVLAYTQQVINSGSVLQFDSEDCIVSEIEINGYNATLFVYTDDKINLYWLDDKYLYTISCFDKSVDVDTVIQIAESIK